MKKMINKLQKMLMCLLLAASNITFTPVFAEDDDLHEHHQNEAQIGNHFNVDQKDGTTNTEMILKGDPTYVVDQEDWNVKVDKTIRNTGIENLFEITLTVQTKKKVSEIAKPKDAAVVLVFDLSSSMRNYKLGDTNVLRVDAAKAAAQEFLNLYAETNGGERKIAIVGFDVNGNIKQTWTDASALLANDSDKDGLCDAIDSLSTRTGTNIAAGLLLARNLLEDSAYAKDLEGIEYKSVILLSDGAPYRYLDEKTYDFSKTSYTSYSGKEGDNHKCHAQPPVAASYILDSGIEINSVFCGDADETVEKGYTSNCSICKTSTKTIDFLANFSTSVVEAYDTADLTQAFKDIEEKIEIATQAWQGTDPMGTNGQLSGVTSSTNPGEVVATKSNLNWNLLNATPTETVEGNTTIYTYSVKYISVLNTLEDTYEANVYYPSNAPTKLDYYLIDAKGNSTGDKQIYFNIPSVKGYEAGIFELVKVDENGVGLGGATFTLKHVQHTDVCEMGHAHACDGTWSSTAVSDENGFIRFDNIPSGHKYILEETVVPENYQSSGETHNVEVKYGKVYIDGAIGNSLTVVNKQIEYVDLSGTKKWVGNSTTPSTIEVKLYGMYEVDGTPYYVTGLDQATEEKIAYDTKEVEKSNNWKYSWDGTNDEIYKYCLGNEITWFVEETPVENYLTIKDGMNLTNVYVTTTDTKFDYVVTKYWVNDGSEVRPKELELTLYQVINGVEEKVNIEPTWDNKYTSTWTFVYSGLDKFDSNGNAIQYKVVETVPSGYKQTGYSEKDATSATVLNTNPTGKDLTVISKTQSSKSFTISNDTVSVVMGKSGSTATVWSSRELSNDEEASLRSLVRSKFSGISSKDSDISFKTGTGQIYKSGTKTANISKTGTTIKVTFGKTDVWETWAYGVVDLYKKEYTPGTTTFTNTYYADVTVKKVWNDANNQDGIRPSSLVVTLSNGQSVVLNDSNNWEATIRNLPGYENGEKIVYTWTEGDMPEGYALTNTEVVGNVTTLTNTHIPATTEATVVKQWDDANNQDGKRPTSLTVTLSNGTEVTLNETNNWSATVNNLPVYANGQKIEYTWTEGEMPEGYALTNTSVNGTVTTLTNSYKPETTSVTVNKVWNDANNQDGKRPVALVVTLSNGQTVTLNDGNNWSATVENLPVYKDGQKIEYTWTEGTMPEGYALTSTVVNGTITTLTNSYTPETVKVFAEKVWDDANNQDGKRPATITYHLIANDKHAEMPKTVSSKDGWKAEWKDLPKYENGREIVYSVFEEVVNEYTTSYGHEVKGNEITFTVTNTRAPEKTSISVEKVWDDANNQDGIRPESVRVELYGNETLVDTVELRADKDGYWEYTWNNLDVYANGEKIVYSVEEQAVAGYESEVDFDEMLGNVFEITNTHTPELFDLSGVKTWNDNNNQDGIRPEKVTIILMADGLRIGSQVVSGTGNAWTYEFADLPVYLNGEKVTYTIDEVAVDGYDKVVDGYDVTNTHIPATTEATVVKQWDDANNQDGKRPTSLTVTLSNGTEVTLSEVNNWKATVTELPVYANGEVIEYTWTEGTMPEGYALTNTSVNGTVTTLTNSYTPETVEITGTKTWDDANNQDGVRPSSITVNIFANGALCDSVVVTAEDDWKYAFANLPKYSEGQVIDYTITEDAVDNYTSTINGYDITNTHIPAVTHLTVKKVWDDNNNQDGIRPSSLDVQLSNGMVVTLNELNLWSTTVINLPKYEDGKEIVYTWTEVNVPDGYVLSDTLVSGAITTLTNTHTPETTSLTVSKVWDDANNQDGKRPVELKVVLNTKEEVILNAANNWTATVADLPVYANGHKIVYTWAESDMPEGYVLTDTTVVGTVTTFTNSYEPETTTATVTKVWDDANNQDGKRPASLVVTLSNGQTVTLNAENEWTAKVENLPVYADGEVIEYTWSEQLPTGYTLSDVAVNGTITTLTNSYTPETTTATVTKQWDDANNQDGKRPTSLTVTLSNGQTVTLNAANNWSATVNNLPKYEAGKEIVYTWTEGTMSEGYELTNTKVNGIFTTLTNSHTPETIDVMGTKTWNDNNNQDGIRPNAIIVKLMVNGREVDYRVVKAADEWTFVFENLPKYENGKEIVYAIEETVVDGYTVEVDGYDLVNTHIPAVKDITITKSWDDADDQDGYRPNQITVELLANNKLLLSANITGAEDWTYTFEGLPVYENGKEIVYTVKELAVDKYSSTINGYNILNTHVPETTSLFVEKVWDDASNLHKTRPQSIKVVLLANGVQTDKVMTLSNDNNWSGAFEDLPKYKDGVEIQYSADEVEVPNEYTKVSVVQNDNKVVITNKMKPRVPNTADKNSTVLWNFLLVVSGLGAVVSIKKRKDEE